MNVRAKLKCRSIQHFETGSPNDMAAEVILYPVYGDGKENASWSKYTPSGEVKLTITNPAAIDAFSPGKSYFLDFTAAD